MPTLNVHAYYDGLNQPQKLRAHGKLLYVADFGGNRIAQIDYDGNLYGDIGVGFLNQPQGVSFINDDLIVVDSPRRLRRFDPSGVLSASTTIPASVQPQTVTFVPPTGETVITEFDNDQLICLDTTFNLVNTLGSGVTGITSPGPNDFYDPKDVLYVEDQQVGSAVYIADSANRRVLRVRLRRKSAVGKMTLDANNTTVFAGGQAFRPVGLTYDPKNEAVFCVDGTGGDIWMIDVRSGSINRVHDNYGNAPGQLMNATGIELVAGELLAVSDWNTNRVTIFEL
jgi:sugar lactone lactonase YvrE